MATILKRSVSPFGTAPESAVDAFSPLEDAFLTAFGAPSGEKIKKFSVAAHLPAVPERIRQAAMSPANDLPWLDEFCAYLVRMRPDLEDKKLAPAVWEAMEGVFDRKTELFLVDHLNREHCEKMGLPDDHRDIVLFARERDTIVARFLAAWTEREPGAFGEFVRRWTESENPDRTLHFLDFCAGAKNPTFEHYLLFTHPVLERWVSNKAQLRALVQRVRPVLKKLKSPTWETDIRAALGLGAA